jgi:hypothetical protein
MRSNTLNKNLVISYGIEDKSVEVEIELTYYKTTYGEDADGNRGIPALELDHYIINISNVCNDGTMLNEDDKAEVYKYAFAELMADWEVWVDERGDK